MPGGEQEFGVRAGTLAVHNIVGFGKAAEIAYRDLKKDQERIKCLDDKLCREIQATEYLSLTVPVEKRVPGIISIIVNKRDFNNERFLKAVGEEIALSTGSACSAGEPSYVIDAIGQKDNTTRIIRISLNKYTCENDIDSFIRILKNNV